LGLMMLMDGVLGRLADSSLRSIHFWSLMALVLKQTSTSDSFAQLRKKAEFTVARFKAAPENLNFDSSGQE
jgi:hypothetical protein